MMDFYQKINKHLIFPLYLWKDGDKRLQRLAELEESQFFNSQKIANLQLSRLKKIITYAYQHTSYYKQVMNENHLAPDDFQSLKDIELLPYLTKSIIQDNLDALISDQYQKSDLLKDASGGSTGVPTIFYKNKEHQTLRCADQIRHDRWCGWDIGKPTALIWGAQRDLPGLSSFKVKIYDRFVDRIWVLDAFEMSEETMRNFVIKLESINPAMLLAYANAIYVFAVYLKANNPDHKMKIGGIITSAETLTAEKRNTIEEVFKCKVLNRYGSREVGLIASECGVQKGLHINAENIYLEIAGEKNTLPTGASGEIVVTDFWNFGMPFIRYKMGDIGNLSEKTCSCGRGLPLLGAVEGRTGDFFTALDGTKVHGEYFTHLFYKLAEVKQFQMIQESKTQITLKIVETPQATNRNYLEPIISKTKNILGKEVQINTEFLEKIPSTQTGKFLFTISKIA